MKALYTERMPRGKRKTIAQMEFLKGPAILLEFTDGSKLKFGNAFICDAIEYYLEHIIRKGLNATKIRKK